MYILEWLLESTICTLFDKRKNCGNLHGLNVWPFCHMVNVNSVVHILPHLFKYVCCNRCTCSKMCHVNWSISFSWKGGTYTKSLTCPHKKKSHGVRSRDLGSHFIKGVCLSSSTNPAVRQMLTLVCRYGCMKTGRCPILLEETLTVPLKNKVYITGTF